LLFCPNEKKRWKRNEWLLFSSKWAIFHQLYHGDDKLHFDEMISALWIFYSDSSLKQQSAGRHVVPLWHIILIPRQPVFVLTPYCCLLNGEAANTNLIVFSLTRPSLEPTIYHTQGEYPNHCTTDAVRMESEGYSNVPIHPSMSFRWKIIEYCYL